MKCKGCKRDAKPGVGLLFGIFIYFVDRRSRKRERLRELGVGGKQAKNLIK